MKKIISGIAIAALMTGCANIQKIPLNADASAALNNQAIVSVTRAKPDFAAITPGKAAFAMLGAVAMISAGNDLVKLNDVDDPANAISLGLLQELQSARAARPIAPAVLVDGDEPEKLIAASKGSAKYVLDVQTINWSLAYFPTDWTHYRVMYVARARLIDAESRKVVAEGKCARVPDSNENAPSYDELVADKAQRLKKELQIAADGCVKSLKTEMLAL